MERTRLEEEILAYLASHHTLSLATTRENIPHAASVFYVNEGFYLYFVSSPSSRHGMNLAQNPWVSATINEDYAHWQKIKGIQLEGKVRLLGGIWEKGRIGLLFVKKFPDVAQFFVDPRNLNKELFAKVEDVKFYEIIPSRISFIDNEKGFSHRETLELTLRKAQEGTTSEK